MGRAGQRSASAESMGSIGTCTYMYIYIYIHIHIQPHTCAAHETHENKQNLYMQSSTPKFEPYLTGEPPY